MSRVSSQNRHRVTVLDLMKRKAEGKRISMITCYDSSFARLINETEIDIVLVGDSLGNVMLGHENTIPVTMQDMIHHTAAVSRALAGPFLCADMPFLSYNLSPEQALLNAGELVQKAGAHGVKMEGGKHIAAQVKKVVEAGIPVMGHLGLTPQSVHTLGGYRVQGREDHAKKVMMEDAMALQDAGVFSLVLEMVPADLAAEITKQLKVPTIGIGAGPRCDAQVLVLQDLLGFDESFKPKFLKRYANLGQTIVHAIKQYDQEVKEGSFPGPENSF